MTSSLDSKQSYFLKVVLWGSCSFETAFCNVYQEIYEPWEIVYSWKYLEILEKPQSSKVFTVQELHRKAFRFLRTISLLKKFLFNNFRMQYNCKDLIGSFHSLSLIKRVKSTRRILIYLVYTHVRIKGVDIQAIGLRCVYRILLKIYDRRFCKNSERIKAADYFCKKAQS